MKTPDTKALEAAAILAGAIQSSAEWHEMISAQQAAKEDTRFAKILARHKELFRAQRNAEAGGQGLGGKELVEMIALQDQIQRHEICVRQQEAGQAVVSLLQRANQVISENLGLDFASNASSRRGGCCG
jgi:cell fate (sporulation/competence/biofilm development) regulator YlbF (YheA/YmcA/DUF963 family)